MNNEWGDNARASLGIQLLTFFAVISFAPIGSAQIDIEEAPINYTDTPDDNAVTKLIAQLEAEETNLEYDRTNGYLRSILKSLDVHESTQTLVFSKTSLQVRHISPRNPRAIYFNDDVYVGWVRGSDIMELSTSDPKLGAAFYTVTMSPARAKIQRAGYECLGCHVTSMTQAVPGHTVRSVFPKLGGSVDSKQRSFVTDHTSPIAERWGGWYVTGLHGDMKHMGNSFLRDGQLNTKNAANRANLRDEFQTLDWLSPYSDIVALMVLEHQTQMHNTFTRANFAVRHAIYDHEQNSSSDDSAASRDELNAITANAASEVVDFMLFVDEAPLTSKIKGSIIFRGKFRRRGPNDSQGRSLREFDLESRLFRYPCSYLIYSSAFDTLEESLRQQIYARLKDVLHAADLPSRYAHLNQATRETISVILRETKPELAANWKASEARLTPELPQ